VFFDDLHLPRPDVYLGVGSGSHAEQTARVMLAFEPVLEEQKPDLVLVEDGDWRREGGKRNRDVCKRGRGDGGRI